MKEENEWADIDSLIDVENKKLRQENCSLIIYRRGRRVGLRGTLPSKPSHLSKKPSQQYISLGVWANRAGIKTAISEARKVSALMALRQFDWKPYLREEIERSPTFGSLIEDFKTYFFDFSAARQKESRWRTIERTLKLLPLKEEFSMTALDEAVMEILQSIKGTARHKNAKQELTQFILFIRREKFHDL